jgi:hypothetical protein
VPSVPPPRAPYPSRSEFDELKAAVEATGSHKAHSIPPTWGEIGRRWLWYAPKWLAHTPSGTAVSAISTGIVVSIVEHFTHFWDWIISLWHH